MIILIFFFKKTHTQTNKIPQANLFIQIYVFFLQTTNVRALYFSTQRSAVRVVFKCKLCLKNSIKLMIFIFLWPPGQIFYLSPACLFCSIDKTILSYCFKCRKIQKIKIRKLQGLKTEE